MLFNYLVHVEMRQDVVGDLCPLPEGLPADLAGVVEQVGRRVVDHQLGTGTAHEAATLATVRMRMTTTTTTRRIRLPMLPMLLNKIRRRR